MTAKDIYNLQRAMTGIQPLRTHYKDKIVKLLDIAIASKNEIVNYSQEKIPGFHRY